MTSKTLPKLNTKYNKIQNHLRAIESIDECFIKGVKRSGRRNVNSTHYTQQGEGLKKENDEGLELDFNYL